MRRRSTPAPTTWVRRPAPAPTWPTTEVDQLRGHGQRQRARGSTSGDNAGPLNVNVTENSDIVCTITNSRETGKLEVVKDLNPSNDPGKFNLQIDGTTDPDAGERGRRGLDGRGDARTPAPTTWARPPAPAPTWPTTRSRSSCVEPTNGNAPAGSTSGDSAGPLNVSVTTGSDIVCTITNTRETGKLEVVKDLNPSTTPASSTSRSTAPPTRTPPTSATAGSTGEETLEHRHPQRG